MRVKRYFAPHLIHELLRCYASLRFAPVGAEQTSTGCLAPRNSTHIRNPLIFQGKSQGHQSKIDDSPHVCAGQQVRALILQAGTSSDLLTLVSYYNRFVANLGKIREGFILTLCIPVGILKIDNEKEKGGALWRRQNAETGKEY